MVGPVNTGIGVNTTPKRCASPEKIDMVPWEWKYHYILDLKLGPLKNYLDQKILY